MTTITSVDIRLVLGRIRPGAAYHWRGDGQFGNDLSAIGDWRDPNTTPPTEAEILAEWEVVVAEVQVAADDQVALDNARAANRQPLAVADYSGEAATMQQLAGKIAWLEQEIAALGGQ
jgi:hypothetical protein